MGGAGGAVVVDAGVDADGGYSCGRTNERFEMLVEHFDGRVFGCNAGKDKGNVQLEGQIVQVTGDGFMLDSCPPNADCIPMLSRFSMPGSYPFLPMGSYVTVYFEVQQPWGCYQRILINSLPVWGGEPNPNGGGKDMIFAAADGTIETFPASPFSIDKFGLNCMPGEPSCGGITPDDYVLKFTELATGNHVEVPMGETASWTWTSQQPGYWGVQNLRSYESGYCDDSWNWAYRITMQGIK